MRKVCETDKDVLLSGRGKDKDGDGRPRDMPTSFSWATIVRVVQTFNAFRFSKKFTRVIVQGDCLN